MFDPKTPRRLTTLWALLFALCSASCGAALSPRTGPDPGGPSPPGPDPDAGTSGLPSGVGSTLTGGVLATLEDGGEVFRVWVTEPQAAQTLVDVFEGRVAFTNLTGPLRPGSGPGEHNAPWSWHLDPSGILVNIHTFAPVYSARPSVVEANLQDLLARGEDKMTGNVGSRLSSVQDRR